MSKQKFDIGDRVKIIENISGSINKIGDIGFITEISFEDDFCRVDCGNNECGNWSNFDELELIKEKTSEKFTTKDSGKRVEFASGFVRDTNEGKPRYDLIPVDMLKRLAELYARGAVKYGDSNWKKAETEEEMNRFKESAWRHFIQWQSGETDEDHAMAVVFNVFAYEHLQDGKSVV